MLSNCKQLDTNFQPNRIIAIDLPQWLFVDLCKIQSAWSVPVNLLVREALEVFISEHWDLRRDKPKKLKWILEEENRKPRVHGAFKSSQKNFNRRQQPMNLKIKLTGGHVYE